MRNKKYSIAECIATCAIISILASLTVAIYRDARQTAKSVENKNNLKQIQMTFEAYKKDNGFAPLSLSDLNLEDQTIDSNEFTYDNAKLIVYHVSPDSEEQTVNILFLHGSTLGNDGKVITITQTQLQDLIKEKQNNGHGNNVDGVDSSNPGKSKQGQDSDPNVDDEKVKGKK